MDTRLMIAWIRYTFDSSAMYKKIRTTAKSMGEKAQISNQIINALKILIKITLREGEIRSNNLPNIGATNCERTWAGKYTIITIIGIIILEKPGKRFSIKYAEIKGEYIVPVMEVAKIARIKTIKPT